MKSIRLMLAFGALLLVVAVANAQEKPKLPLPEVQPQPLLVPQPGVFPGFPGGDLISAKGLEKLALSKEQKADYDKVSDEYKKKQKELQEKLLDATKNPDPKTLLGIVEAQQKLRPDYLTKVEKLLTEDQKKTFDDVRREFPGIGIGPIVGVQPPFPFPMPGMNIGGPFLPVHVQQRLKLSDDQKKKVDELQKELESKILGVLTDEQKKQFEEMKKQLPGFGVFPRPIDIRPPEINPPVLPLPPLKKE